MDLLDEENEEQPQFAFQGDDNSGRVIKKYDKQPKFRPGDEVYYIADSEKAPTKKEGPYTVASMPEVLKYTLCLAAGQPVKSGALVEEKNLVAV